MARSLSLLLSRKSLIQTPPFYNLISVRARSTNQPTHTDLSDIDTASSDPMLQKLESAIHRIIVRRSAPKWLPFLPGSSYWVPPPNAQNYGISQLAEKLANPLNLDEYISTTTFRGWPSSDYFINGPTPESIEEETDSNNKSKNEEEEK